MSDETINGGGSLDINGVPIIVRREIEALIAAPLIKAFIAEVGEEKTLKIAREVIRSLAHESGKALSAMAGGNSMAHYQRVLPLFSRGGALEMEILETGSKTAAFNVTKCKYAEMYKVLGLEELGYLLSCGRDRAMIEGFNPGIKFARTQTIMEGGDYCDFRLSLDEE
jgi:fumarate reductase iron-sulfur subunit